MEETYSTEAIVLKRVPFREYDLRLVLYSGEKGILDLVARGAKRQGSKLAGHLEPLNKIRLMVAKGKQYDYLASALCVNAHQKIKEDLILLEAAGQAVGIFKKISREGSPDNRLYEELGKYLDFLEKRESDVDDLSFVFHAFILRLVCILGYTPRLDNCQTCGTEKAYIFSAESGSLFCSNCINGRAGVILGQEEMRCLKMMIDQKKYNDLSREKNADEKLIKNAIRTLFEHSFDINYRRIIY